MKKMHPFLTSNEDSALVSLLSLTDLSEAEVDEAKAERLYFTEYDYVFHSTDNTYAIYAARHYDMGGHEIFSAGVNFHDMQWMEIIEKSIPFKAKAAYNKL